MGGLGGCSCRGMPGAGYSNVCAQELQTHVALRARAGRCQICALESCVSALLGQNMCSANLLAMSALTIQTIWVTVVRSICIADQACTAGGFQQSMYAVLGSADLLLLTTQ